MQITMGKVDKKAFAVDTEVLRSSHLLITGVSGSGKSYRLRVLAESLAPVMPVFILDPEGEYYTLREKFPFMLFGEGGDAGMAPETARLTAQKVLEWKTSAIFDLSSLEVDQQHEWVAEFISELMVAPRELWYPKAILIDEAHLWAPEKGEASSVALRAVSNLCARGRKRGYFITLATQRLSRLANNCASEMQNQLIGRTTLPADRERAAKAFGVINGKDKAELFGHLKTLHNHYFYGQGLAIGPDRVLLAPTEAQTTHIRPGEIQQVIPATPDKIREFLPQLSRLSEQAHEQLDTEAKLRSTIAHLAGRVDQLEAELAGKGSAGLEAFAQETAAALRGMLERIEGSIDGRPLPVLPAWSPSTPPNGHASSAPKLAPRPDTPPLPEGMLPEQARILAELRSAELAGISEVPRTWLAAMARVRPRSSTYSGNLGNLLAEKYVTYPSPGMVALTAEGRALTKPWQPLSTAKLLEGLQAILPKAGYSIVRALAEQDGEWKDRDTVAGYAGMSPTSSSFTGLLAELRKFKYIESGGNKTVRVSDWIYLNKAGQAANA